MNILELRTEKERTLFTLSLVVSIAFWVLMILGTLGIGLFYIAAGAGFVLVTQALFLAAIKGNGVRISAEQLPDLHRRIENAAARLHMSEVPEAYLLNQRGLFNAFATRFLGRNFIVLYADLLEACDEKDGSIDFIIGHELGHLALGHLKMAPVLLPSRFLPLLGAAYSRSCEYSCDRAGTVAAQRPDSAIRGLAVLAAGGRYAARIDVEKYLEQRLDTSNFWLGVVELGMSHPYLPKRIGALIADTKPEIAVPQVARNPFSYVVAPMLSGGGAGAGLIGAMAVAGIVAAVAVPSFMKYREASAALGQRMRHQEVEQIEQLDVEDLGKQIDEASKPEQQRIDAEAKQLEDRLKALSNQAVEELDQPRNLSLEPRKSQARAKRSSSVSVKKAAPAPKAKRSRRESADDEVLY